MGLSDCEDVLAASGKGCAPALDGGAALPSLSPSSASLHWVYMSTSRDQSGWVPQGQPLEDKPETETPYGSL